MEQTYCWLAEDFGFIDKNGIGWQADKGDKTDGASIPKWAQRFVGVPFTPEYLKASVLHDHYSKSVRPVRGWFETQRMFHEVLLASGVSSKRAAVLYAGVLLGSGKWITRIEGRPCEAGTMCFNSVPGPRSDFIASYLVTEPESFGERDYRLSFRKLKAAIEASDGMSESEVEALVLVERPDSVFLANPSGYLGHRYHGGYWE